MITCKICNFQAHDISSHVRAKHNMIVSDYKKQYNSEVQSEERKNKNRKSSNSPFSLQFYINKGLSIEEAKDELEVFLNKHSNIMKSSSHFSLNYWIKKGYIESEAKHIISKNSTRSKNEFIEKYGKEKGIEKYNEWCSKIGYKCSLQYLIDNDASEQEIEEFRKSKNITSLKSFILRYGESLGTEKYYNFCANKGVTLEKMIELYGEYEGQIRYDSWRKSCSHDLDFFIKKYGPHEGQIKYDSWVEACNKFSYYSAISYELFNKINIEGLLFGDNEKKIGKYFVDLFYNNKIVEFYGDYWHCNPTMFNPEDMNYSIGKPAWRVWEADEKRINYLKEFNYKILIIWESDYLSDPEKVINEIEKFLKGK